MSRRSHVRAGSSLFLTSIAATLLLSAPTLAQHGSQAFMGYPQLLERLGPLAPTGESIVVAEIEAPNDQGAYGPNQNNPDFNGKIFYEMSGPAGNSGHATTVGRFLFGLTWSMAPGINEIYLYSALGWLQNDFLRANQPGTTPPLISPTDVRIMNHSWVGTVGANTNVALQRADFVAARDNVLMVSGVNNGPPAYGLMTGMYNGLAVGIRAGTHESSDTLSGLDGPGRMKPEIVAPDNFTSFATPMVGAAAALLLETAETWPTLIDEPDAERIEVIKVALLAGATRENLAAGTWSNHPDLSGPTRGRTERPIDPIVGAGTVNVDRSHQILTGVRTHGSPMPGTASSIDPKGWDLVTLPAESSAFYRIRLAATAPEIGITTTWNRRLRLPFPSGQVADIDLILWRRAADGSLETLLGDEGLPYFSSGNVVSASAVDNIEKIVIRDLAQGEYILEVRRNDAVVAPFPTFDAAIGWLLPASAVAQPADLNLDGVIDLDDLLILLGNWGSCRGCPADITGDGVVDLADLLLLLSAWGT